jgi:hypothetical protein
LVVSAAIVVAAGGSLGVGGLLFDNKINLALRDKNHPDHIYWKRLQIVLSGDKKN